MRLLNIRSLGRLVTWAPCHEFFMSLPGLSSLLRSNGKEAAKASRSARSADSIWGFLNWWPSLDAVKLFLALLLISAMFAEIRCVVSSSMCPTLQAGDRVIVEKVSYYFKNPSIDDIVTFRAPEVLQDIGYKKEDIFIKRIVAKAGDLLEVRRGVLHINGTARRETFISEEPAYSVRATVCPHYLFFPYFAACISYYDVPAERVLEQHMEWSLPGEIYASMFYGILLGVGALWKRDRYLWFGSMLLTSECSVILFSHMSLEGCTVCSACSENNGTFGFAARTNRSCLCDG